LLSAFSSCDKGSELTALNDSLSLMATRKTRHENCRKNEVKKWEKWNPQASTLAAMETTMTSARSTLTSLTPTDLTEEAKQCEASSGTSYIEWARAKETLFSNWVKNWEDAKERYDNATEEHRLQKIVADDLHAIYTNKTLVCNRKQASFERKVCRVNSSRTAVCDTTCYDDALRRWQESTPTLQNTEAARKITWRVLERINCLLQILETSGGAEDIESCRQKTHNTSTLDLDWGTLPSPASCPTATYVVPCENDFESTYYYSLNRHCQGVVTAQCVPCNAEEGEGEGEEEEYEE